MLSPSIVSICITRLTFEEFHSDRSEHIARNQVVGCLFRLSSLQNSTLLQPADSTSDTDNDPGRASYYCLVCWTSSAWNCDAAICPGCSKVPSMVSVQPITVARLLGNVACRSHPEYTVFPHFVKAFHWSIVTASEAICSTTMVASLYGFHNTLRIGGKWSKSSLEVPPCPIVRSLITTTVLRVETLCYCSYHCGRQMREQYKNRTVFSSYILHQTIPRILNQPIN